MNTMLMAYVDGELDAEGRAAFEAELASDPALQAALAREQRLRMALNAAYGPVLEEPIPARLSAMLMQAPATAPVISLAAVRERRAWGWSQWGGMAASLMLGVLLGYQVLPSGDSFAAQGALAQALDEALSGQQQGGVTPGLSFVAKGGGYCRSFSTSTQAGLACRDGRQWRLQQLLPVTPDAAAQQYRMAASSLPPALLQHIDALREGEVLDAQAEQRARGQRWQK